RPVCVELDRDGDTVGRALVDEVGEGQDPFVPDAGGGVHAEHPREVALLNPELRGTRRLVQEEANDCTGGNPPTRDRDLEPGLGDVVREQAGVVAEAVDGRRAGRDAVLLEAALGLSDVAGEEDPAERDALPEGSERWQAAV